MKSILTIILISISLTFLANESRTLMIDNSSNPYFKIINEFFNSFKDNKADKKYSLSSKSNKALFSNSNERFINSNQEHLKSRFNNIDIDVYALIYNNSKYHNKVRIKGVVN